MKKWMFAITVVLLVGLGAASAQAVPNQGGSCDTSGSAAVKVLSTTALHSTTYDLVGSGGEFEEKPLFVTSVKTGNQSCIIATFSVMVVPRDNWVVFQVLVDGQPMYGHMSSDDFFTLMGNSEAAEYVDPPTPLVGDPEVTNHNLFRMLSYTFYLPVAQGTHTVEVKWAGCCTTRGPNGNKVEIGGANLLVYYR
jgi:hypothetical protein